MPQDQNNLVWLDMEMTGLEPERDRIIEIAIVVTDSQLNTVAEAQVLVVHQSDGVLASVPDDLFQGRAPFECQLRFEPRLIGRRQQPAQLVPRRRFNPGFYRFALIDLPGKRLGAGDHFEHVQ